MVNRATIFCVCFHLFLPTHLRVHCSSPWFCIVPFYLLIYSFVMCFCTSLVISNIDIWSVPKMSRNEASFTICRPSFGSCKLLALMYTHNALVISGRVISPVMFNVLANVVDNCTFCVIIAGFFLGRDEVSVEDVEKNEEEEEEERDGRRREDTVAGATLDVRAIILMRFMFVVVNNIDEI